MTLMRSFIILVFFFATSNSKYVIIIIIIIIKLYIIINVSHNNIDRVVSYFSLGCSRSI